MQFIEGTLNSVKYRDDILLTNSYSTRDSCRHRVPMLITNSLPVLSPDLSLTDDIIISVFSVYYPGYMINLSAPHSKKQNNNIDSNVKNVGRLDLVVCTSQILTFF